MKLDIFDVVELINHRKGIILESNSEGYKVKIIKDDEKVNEIKLIQSKDIKKIIFKK